MLDHEDRFDGMSAMKYGDSRYQVGGYRQAKQQVTVTKGPT